MLPDDTTERIAELCRRLGASEPQAHTMAAQLVKRAGQLATERNISEIEALNHLLTVLISGREGNPPPQLPPDQGSSLLKNLKNDT